MTRPSDVAEGRVPDAPLIRNRDFQLLWTGSVFSSLSREMTDLAYPLLILSLTGSPAATGAFGGAQLLTSLLVGMPVGELADRFDRRRLLLLAQAVRLAATATVVLALTAGTLTFAHLLTVAVVVGATEPLAGAARMVLVRAVVPSSRLTAALTQDEVRTHGAALSGPPLGGALYAIAAAVPIVTAMACQVLSLLTVSLIRPPSAARRTGPRSDENDPVLRRMAVGLRVLYRVPTLRYATLTATMLNLAGAPLVLITVVMLEDRGVPSGQIGLTVTAMAAGGLAGAALVGPLQRRLRPGVLMLACGLSTAVLITLLPAPFGSWWAAVPLFLLGLVGPSVRILVDVLIFRQVPDEQRGRVIAAFMTILGVGSSAGLFGAGLLLDRLAATHATLVLGGLLAACMLAAMAARGLRTARWPEDEQDSRA
ncbi:MFS transporter [Spongiactinospora sp. TRM90649]|uniref:MFS transporter n=1 Tax=Spongiactinospora sp. TRM90649 TaxID=3031114 RepID=UPI0023F7D138|nr:MFS transporter [Spongiactinospora sp. TRM90649]MDF5753141.1 MFS transporter [Spongiactinospora sp. TRM90649]